MKDVKPTKKQLNTFAEENAWSTLMSNNGIDSFSNYSGENLGKLVVVLSQNRDSEILDVSNFESALELLGGESDTVHVRQFGHWGCGWFKLILVDQTDIEKLKIAYDIYTALKDYPILNETDLDERECEYQSEFSNSVKDDIALALSIHFGIKHTKKLIDIAYELNMVEQQIQGNDSCINISKFKNPDMGDIKQLKRALELCECNFVKSIVYKKLKKSVDCYVVKTKKQA